MLQVSNTAVTATVTVAKTIAHPDRVVLRLKLKLITYTLIYPKHCAISCMFALYINSEPFLRQISAVPS